VFSNSCKAGFSPVITWFKSTCPGGVLQAANNKPAVRISVVILIKVYGSLEKASIVTKN
jgi:hypothetical protein